MDKLPREEYLKNIPENLVPVFMPRSGHSYKTFRALKKYSKKLEEYHKLAGKRKLPLKEWWNEYSNPGTPRQPYFSFHALQEFRKVQKEFLTGVLMIPSMEKEFSLAAGEFTFLNYYINSRLLWDPELNLDSLLEEYLRDMYGKAAEKMKFFYTFSREVSSRPNPRKLHLSRGQMSPKEPAIFLELLAGAKAEVPKESPYYARIEKLEKTFRELQKAFLKIEFSSPLIKGEIFPYDTPCTGDLRKYTSWHTFSFTGKKNSPSTKIAIAFTENRKKLFIAFQCFEKEISKRKIKEIPRDTPAIAGEDHLAIHLSSPENNGSRILLDLSGNILDGSYCPFSIEKLGSYLAWNGVENHVVRRKADRWEGEIKIDLAGFGKGPDHFPPWEIRVERFRNGKKLSKFHRTIKIAKTDASNYPVNSHYMKLVPLPECREESIYIIQRAKGKADISAPWESKTWKDVPFIRMNWAFEKIPQTKFRPETQAKLLYDDENLYILYQVHDQYVRGEIKEDQGMVCSDSCVELFLQPVKGGKYYNFECNCIGSLLLYECRFSGKNMFAEPMPSSALQKIKRFTTLPRDLKGEIREKITYRIGLQIPLSLITERNAGIKLPLKGQIWRGNMYKCADYSSHGVQLAWKKCATFHAPDDFGLFIFE